MKLLNSSPFEFALVLDSGAKFEVLVGNLNVAASYDFLHGIACVIATHVFNVTYSQYLCCTMQFIQKHFLEISDSSVTKQKVITLMARLRKSASGL